MDADPANREKDQVKLIARAPPIPGPDDNHRKTSAAMQNHLIAPLGWRADKRPPPRTSPSTRR